MRIGSIVMNVKDLQRAADFWSGALHYRLQGGAIPEHGCPVLESGTAGAPTVTLDTDDGFHVDLHVDSAAEQEAEIARLTGLGARRVEWEYGDGATHVVLADPEGNLFCVVNTGLGDASRST